MKSIFLFLVVLFSSSIVAHPFTPCDENIGMADIYPCHKIDLLSRVHIEYMGGDSQDNGNDIWGWTDPETGKEYALMGLSYGTYFVDISDPKNPIKLGILPTQTSKNLWRDLKTYKNYVFIVSQARNHGMQVFDLTQLRDVSNPPIQFSATTVYTNFKEAHNIVINEESGFAYAVGTETCAGGLHMIDIRQPQNPIFAGCFANGGYTHDAQCVNYHGPDTNYIGKEICFNANEDTVTIVNVTNKNNPLMISSTSYSTAQYTHQGWLTEDQRYFLFNDELDEENLGFNTRTYILDVMNLDAPELVGFYSGPKKSIDHNLYIRGNLAYLTNYTSGLRIVDISNIESLDLQEIASFDTFPNNDDAAFEGAWSSYPYFSSGKVIVSDFESGLFILKPNLCPAIEKPRGLIATTSVENKIDLLWNLELDSGEAYRVYRSTNSCESNDFEKIADGINTNSYTDDSVIHNSKYAYKISKFKQANNEMCESDFSICMEVQTQKTIQAGLWYDKSRSGHGFVIEPIGENNQYFTIFYTYQQDGTPEWYTSLATLENGVLNVNLSDDTLQRFIYDYDLNIGNPSVLDDSIGTNILAIDFNSDNLANPQVCDDGVNRGDIKAVAHWQIGSQTGDWCISPIIAQSNAPTPDFGGTWWAGSEDSGWGLSLAFSNDNLIAIVYYYDADGQPRWVLGSQNGFEVGQSLNLTMQEYHGFARDGEVVPTTTRDAGQLTIKINNDTLVPSGELSVDINYQGSEGGQWLRNDLTIKNLTNLH